MTLQRYEHQGAAPATGVAANIGSSDTTFTVLSGTGYPTGAVGPFVIAIDPGTSTEEKILCVTRSGITFTVAGGGRGYDGTSAQAHSMGTVNVQHVLAAAEVDDDNDHVYTTTRDDHTQYARTDGTRAVTGTQHFSNQIVVAAGATITAGGETITAGGLTVTAGGISVAAGTTAVQALTATTGSFSSTLGVTGATTLTGGVTGAMAATGAVSGTTVTGTGEVKGTDMNATGLTGAVAGARFVGATTSGAPASGTFVTGDYIVDQSGTMWVCTVGGTSGTWVPVGGQLTSWTTYNPAFTASGGGASVGNGTCIGGYNQIGKQLAIRIQFQVGSTSNGGSGTWRFGLPGSLTGVAAQAQYGVGYINQSTVIAGVASLTASGTFFTVNTPTSATNVALTPVTSTTPANWVNTNILSIHAVVEVQ